MTRRRYEAYRDSGVEWLGEVPAHWDVAPLARTLREPLKYGANEAADGDDPTLPRFVRITDIDDSGRLKPDTFKSLPEEIARPYLLQSGDVLFARSGSVGRTFLYDESSGPCAYAGYLIRARLDTRQARPEFLSYFSKSRAYLSWIRTVAIQATIENVSAEKYARMLLPLPPIGEQRAIAAFLDRETAKVDALIEKKRLLIERLEEQRTALISRTVTRSLPPEAARAAGLDPLPRLKPSGVEWLGEVPEHWTTPPLYTRYSVELGKMLNEERTRGEHLLPYLRNVDVQWDCINLDELPQIDVPPHELARYTVRRGDLLVCEGGEVGRAAIVGDLAGPLAFQKALHRLRPGTGEHPRFMYYTLYFASARGVFLAGGNPNTIIHLTGEMLRRYRFPRPPLAEQRAIASFLDREMGRLDGVSAQVEFAIERLQEYRTALITTAVTGKIDVRESAREAIAAG